MKSIVTVGLMLAGGLAAQAAFVELDNFNRLTNGPLGGRNGWVAAQTAFVVANDPAGGPNKVLSAPAMPESPIYKALGPLTITNGTTGTLFFRMYRANTALNISIGLSDVAAPTAGFGDFEAQINCNTTAGTLNVRDSGTFDAVDTFLSGTWFKVWMVVDNATDLTSVYLQGGPYSSPTLLDGNDGETAFTFRNTTGDSFNSNSSPVANHLIAFLIRIGGSHTGPLYVDDIFVDTAGLNLSDPTLDAQAPGVTQVLPEPGETMPALTSLTVTFTEPVGQVQAAHLLINGLPATQVTGGPEVWTFLFPTPEPGAVAVTWSPGQNIIDFAGNPFPGTNVWNYHIVSDVTPPVLTAVTPAPAATINDWPATTITVTFSEPVLGVDAADLLVNGIPAHTLTWVETNYTFTAAQPVPGVVTVRFAEDHGITDLFNNPFDANLAGHAWTYTFTDTAPPVIAARTPAPGALVLRMDSLEVTFNEAVTGLEAGDLLVNGAPAESVAGAGAGPYLFAFRAPPAGRVQFAWAEAHGITDGSANPFSGGAWEATQAAIRPSGFVLFEDFSAMTNGPLHGQNGWAASNTVVVAIDPEEPRNRALCISNSVNADAWRGLGVLTITNDTVGTVFWRFRRADADINMSHGLSDSLPPEPRNFNDYEAQLQSNGSGLAALNARDATAFRQIKMFTPDVWFSVWLYVDNINDVYSVYLQGDDLPTPILMASSTDINEYAFSFRNAAGDGLNMNSGMVASNLTAFLIRSGGNTNHVGPFYLDDIYVDFQGLNLASPLPLRKPADLEAFAGIGEVVLVWATTPGATNYVVKRGTTPGGPYQPLGITAVEYFTDPTADLNTAYYYAVSALGLNGESFESGEAMILLNQPPLAGGTVLNTMQDQPLALTVTNLLSLCSDPDGDGLAIVAVAPGTNGSTVVLEAPAITYTPPPNFAGTDYFTYTVQDSRGGAAQGIVQVEVAPVVTEPVLLTAPQFSAETGFGFRFQGVGGRTYGIERALDPGGPWTNILYLMTAPDGAAAFADTNAPPARAFYRLLLP